MDEENKIELRSEEFQEVLGAVPPWILRWGITVLAFVIVIFLIGSAIIKYPDVIPAQIILTGSTPPATVVAHASGKIKQLYVCDNQEVKNGEYLAVIDNPAQTEDVLKLKEYLRRNDKLISLPDKNLQLGTLQQLFSSFYTTIFEYIEYKRLLYYPQKKTITIERIAQYEKQYNSLLNQHQITDEQLSLITFEGDLEKSRKFKNRSSDLCLLRGILHADDTRPHLLNVADSIEHAGEDGVAGDANRAEIFRSNAPANTARADNVNAVIIDFHHNPGAFFKIITVAYGVDDGFTERVLG